MDTRTKYIAVVLVSALWVAIESVLIEGALKIADIDIFLVSSVPLISGGLILIAVAPQGTSAFSKGLGRRGWLWMTALCGLSAVGAFMWFDAVGRIGAGKEALLGGGSSEVLFIVVLSAVFLRERLTKLEIVGSLLVVLGVVVVLANAEGISFTVGVGEIEAIVSSLLLGTSVIIATYLLYTNDLTVLSGVQLLYGGALILVFSAVLGMASYPDIGGWLLLLAMGIMPAVGLWTYNAGLPKIGASLTSILFALCGVMTVGIQLIVKGIFPDADIQRPENLALAILGGAVAFIGIYLLNIQKKATKGIAGKL